MFRTAIILLLGALTLCAGWWTWRAQTAHDQTHRAEHLRQTVPRLLDVLPTSWWSDEAVPVQQGMRWRLDGYADDWPESNVSTTDAAQLRVGKDDAQWWFWLSVADAERTHGFGGDLDLPRFDHVRVQAWFADGSMRQVILVVTSPGAVTPYWMTSWPDVEHLSLDAVMRARANGYHMEVSMPHAFIKRMTWVVHDGQNNTQQTFALVPVLLDDTWQALWRAALPADAVFEVQRDGQTWWRYGASPSLTSSASAREVMHQGWRVRWLPVESMVPWSMILPWLGVILAAVVWALWEAGRRRVQSKRVERLQQRSRAALHRGGKRGYKHFDAEPTNDEIGRLSHTLADLLAEVENHADYLSGLAGTLSHELQTPLAIVRSSMDNLELPNLSDEERQTYVARARDGLARMSHLVRQMAEASRLERALDALDRQPLLLNDWLPAMFAGYRDSYPSQQFSCDVKQSDVRALVAVDLLAQALDKLVDNAASYAGAHGTVRLMLDVAQDNKEPMAVLGVVNSGSQLPEGMHARMFDALVSVRDGQKRGDGGGSHLGLGLHVVRLIAKAHGGQVRARNIDADHVIFELLLPLTS